MPRPSEIDLPQRPESDRPLNEEVALLALREQFPSRAFRRATALPPGWASDPYLIDDRFVARFPRNAEMAECLDWDEGILRFVDAALGATVRVPRVLSRGNGGEHFPHGFLVCDFIPGVPLDAAKAPLSHRLASELGEALARIHSIPPASAADIGVRQPEWDEYTGTLAFLHGDFGPANIILHPATGRLEGIIDWGNAQLGDRARDFHRLVLDCGWDFARAVMEAYGLPQGEEFVGRLGFYARMEAAQWLADSVRRGLDPSLHLEWVRNAFSLDGPSWRADAASRRSLDLRKEKES